MDNADNGEGCLKISWVNFPVDGHQRYDDMNVEHDEPLDAKPIKWWWIPLDTDQTDSIQWLTISISMTINIWNIIKLWDFHLVQWSFPNKIADKPNAVSAGRDEPCWPGVHAIYPAVNEHSYGKSTIEFSTCISSFIDWRIMIYHDICIYSNSTSANSVHD